MKWKAVLPALVALILFPMLAACTQVPATPAPPENFPRPTATTVATPTVAPTLPNTPRLEQGPSRLLELMKKFPASFKEQGIWFADCDRALVMAGAPRPRSLEEYLALSQDERDAYMAARRGLVLRADLLEKTRTGAQQWEEAFGFGMFDMDLQVSIGSYSAQPLQLAYLEGDFRKEAMRERLLDLGYEERFTGESVYFAIRGDYEADIRDPAGRRALGSMNRVFVEDGALVAAPDTDRVVKVMQLSSTDRPTLAEELRDRYWLATAIRGNGSGAQMAGDWLAARELYERGLAVAPMDPRILSYLALLEYEVGDFEQGEVYLERCLEVMRESSPSSGTQFAGPAQIIPTIVRITGVVAHLEVAKEAAQVVLSVYSDDRIGALGIRAGQALVSVLSDDVTAAREQYAALERAAGFFAELGMCTDRMLGLLSHTLGNYDRASAHFEGSLALCRKAGARVPRHKGGSPSDKKRS